MIIAGALIGLLIGVLVHYFDVQPFIASLVGMFLARGLAFLVSTKSIKIDTEAIILLQSTRFRLGDWYITPTGIIALLVVLAGILILQFTRFGRTIYAIGGNEQSARLMGLPVVRTKILAYVISGVCGGIAGVVLTAYQGAGYPLNGMGAELDTIAAVVIGGTLLAGGSGYVIGSLVGVLVYGTIAQVIAFLGADAVVEAHHRRRTAARVRGRSALHRRRDPRDADSPRTEPFRDAFHGRISRWTTPVGRSSRCWEPPCASRPRRRSTTSAFACFPARSTRSWERTAPASRR